jgi:hypothetical protein
MSAPVRVGDRVRWIYSQSVWTVAFCGVLYAVIRLNGGVSAPVVERAVYLYDLTLVVTPTPKKRGRKS